MGVAQAQVGLILSAGASGAAVFGGATPGVTLSSSDLFSALTMAVGTGADQYDQIALEAPPIAASGHQDYDLTAIADPFGVAQDMAHVKALAISNPGAADIYLDGTAANAYEGVFAGVGTTPKLVVPAGGFILLFGPGAAGLGAVTGTSKVVSIKNPSGAAITPRVAILGCSA